MSFSRTSDDLEAYSVGDSMLDLDKTSKESLPTLTKEHAAQIKTGLLDYCIQKEENFTQLHYCVFEGLLRDSPLGQCSRAQFLKIIAPIFRDHLIQRTADTFLSLLLGYSTESTETTEEIDILCSIKELSQDIISSNQNRPIFEGYHETSQRRNREMNIEEMVAIPTDHLLYSYNIKEDKQKTLEILQQLNNEIQEIKTLSCLIEYLETNYKKYQNGAALANEQLTRNYCNSSLLISPLKGKRSAVERKNMSVLISEETVKALQEVNNLCLVFDSHILTREEKSRLLASILSKKPKEQSNGSNQSTELSLKDRHLIAILVGANVCLDDIDNGEQLVEEHLDKLLKEESDLLVSKGTVQKIKKIELELLHVVSYLNSEIEKTTEKPAEQDILKDKLKYVQKEINNLYEHKENVDLILSRLHSHESIAKKRNNWSIFDAKSKRLISNIHYTPARKITMYVDSNLTEIEKKAAACTILREECAKKDGTIQAVTLLDAVKMDISKKKASLFTFNKKVLAERLEAIDTAQKNLIDLAQKSHKLVTGNGEETKAEGSTTLSLSTVALDLTLDAGTILSELKNNKSITTQRSWLFKTQKTETAKLIEAVEVLCTPAA